MKVLSWNIAGGHTFNGDKQQGGDYEMENMPWFLEQIKLSEYDIIGLQEAHTPDDKKQVSQVEEVSKSAQHTDFKTHEYADSFIKSGNKLALGNTSTYPILDNYFYLLPNPQLEIIRPDGGTWISFDVGFLVSEIEYMGRRIVLFNCHLVPFHYFKRSFIEEEFDPIKKSIEELFERYADVPSIALGDFNYSDLSEVLPNVTRQYGFTEAFIDTETAPGKGQQDHILYSKHWDLKEYKIIKGRSDHHQCVVELELK